MYQFFILLLLALLPSLPLPTPLIHTSMALHMAVQLPLLLLAGYTFARLQSQARASWPLPMVLSAWIWIYFTLVFWMLPIHLDKAVMLLTWDVSKILSLMVAGYLLHGVLKADVIWGGFFIGSIAVGLIFLGVYYQQADVRVCSNYLLSAQQHAGMGLLAWGVVILLTLFYRAKHRLFTP